MRTAPRGLLTPCFRAASPIEISCEAVSSGGRCISFDPCSYRKVGCSNNELANLYGDSLAAGCFRATLRVASRVRAIFGDPSLFQAVFTLTDTSMPASSSALPQ